MKKVACQQHPRRRRELLALASLSIAMRRTVTFTAAERPREEHSEWRDTWGRISRKYHSEKAESEKLTLKKVFPPHVINYLEWRL